MQRMLADDKGVAHGSATVSCLGYGAGVNLSKWLSLPTPTQWGRLNVTERPAVTGRTYVLLGDTPACALMAF